MPTTRFLFSALAAEPTPPGSLAGMIAICGLPTANFDDALVATAFQAYRNKDQQSALLANLDKCSLYNAKVTMVGVWDTVGSLGIPSVIGGVSPILYGFLDTGLHPDVLNAIQALAIDERRVEYPPTPWTGDPVPGQVLDQVWFCGCHSDVGGGTGPGAEDAGTTLSEITLAWMMSKAAALGLQFAPAAVAKYVLPAAARYALDEIHESWTPSWGFPAGRQISNNSSLRPTDLAIIDGFRTASPYASKTTVRTGRVIYRLLPMPLVLTT
jgi:Uncharacterized alpha/beta hydrolase domain (DUF2235)